MYETAHIQRELEQLHALVQLRREQLSQSSLPQSVSGPLRQLLKTLEIHLQEEDQQLSQLRDTRQRSPGSGEALLAALEREHVQLARLEQEVRAQAHADLLHEEGLRLFLDALRECLTTETERLIPRFRAFFESDAQRVLRQTEGRCEICISPVPAAVIASPEAVELVKYCPTHGETRQVLSRSPEQWAELDAFYFKVNGKSYPQRDYIVRMTETCNLNCPICLAKANTEETPDLDLRGLEQLISSRRGIKIDLMAAEPTLRPDLEEWIRRVKASGNVAALHTNGLKLVDRGYCERLAAAGIDEVFLQFDGFDDDANHALRGARLLRARLRALDNLRESGIATSLIVVVARGLNEPQISETFRFALRPENGFIREVFFLGLRMLGSLREQAHAEGSPLADSTLMPDELLDMLIAQEPQIRRADVHAFNKLYFSMLSALEVKKCLYVQHYLVVRDGAGGYRPISELLSLETLEAAAETYAGRLAAGHPLRARAGLLAALGREALRPAVWPLAQDLLRLEQLMARGMNLSEVPPRMLLLGFITACDPHNFDAAVAVNCGKGELSMDGGFTESGAVANVEREARFARISR